MDDLVVRVCLVSPFASPTGQPQICSEPQRLPAGSTSDAIRQLQAALAERLADDLDASLGWPVDRGRLRLEADPIA
jgi:hypothetical protein